MPSAPAATACPQCSAVIPAGRRFCTNCGYSLGNAPAAPGARPVATAPRAPRPAGSGFSASSLQPLQFGVIGGAVLAVIGTFLAWVKLSGGGFSQSAGAWDGDLADDLAIGDIVQAGIPIDAILIVVLGALALYFLLGGMFGLQVPAIPFATVGLGAAIVVIGAYNYIHIDDQIGDLPGVSIGMGLYLTIIGGAVLAVCAFLDQQQRAKMM
jgi:hypothetical protein